MKDILAKIDNDTLIVCGLIVVAMVALFQPNGTGLGLAEKIVLVFGGYLGGQITSTTGGGK